MTTCIISQARTGSALTECSTMQPPKSRRVSDETIRSITSLTGLHISCILCFFLMLTSHFCSLSISSVDSCFVPYIHTCVGVLARVLRFAFAFPAVVICNTLDAFAPSPGDGPAAMAAGPAADAFGGTGG